MPQQTNLGVSTEQPDTHKGDEVGGEPALNETNNDFSEICESNPALFSKSLWLKGLFEQSCGKYIHLKYHSVTFNTAQTPKF